MFVEIKFQEKLYSVPKEDINDFTMWIKLSEKFSQMISNKYIITINKKNLLQEKINSVSLKNLFLKKFPENSKITLDNNIRTFSSICNYLGKEEICPEDFLDTKNIFNKLEENSKNSQLTLKIKYNLIQKIFKSLDIEEFLPKEYYDRVGQINNIENYPEKNDTEIIRELHNKIKYGEIFEKLNIKNNKTVLWFNEQKKLVYHLYTDFPNIRATWKNIIVIKNEIENETENTFNIETGFLKIINHKNIKFAGNIIVDIKKDFPNTYDILEKFINGFHQKKDEERFYLLLSLNNLLPYKDTNFYYLIENIFFKNVNVNILRKLSDSIFISKNHTVEERKMFYYITGHNPNTQLKYYLRDL